MNLKLNPTTSDVWMLLTCALKNVREIGEDLMELKPTFFAGVPKVFDRVYEGMFWYYLAFLYVTRTLQLISGTVSDLRHSDKYRYQLSKLHVGKNESQK